VTGRTKGCDVNTHYRWRESCRGMSLIEVMIAMLILALLMVGILEMFSLALLTDFGSAARTEMTVRAQQVLENIRYVHYLRRTASANAPSATLTGIPNPPSTSGETVNIPWNTSDSGWSVQYAYWGPGGANVVEGPKAPYRISYSYQLDATTRYWIVTVSVIPAEAAGLASSRPYLGGGTRPKRVDYVAQILR